MRILPVFFLTAAQAAPAFAQQTAGDSGENGAALALLVLIVAVVAWLGLRSFVRSLRTRKTEAAVQGNFNDFALRALVNAAKIDGRVADAERAVVAKAIDELGGGDVDAAFAGASLSKDELVAYLKSKSQVFSHEQKQWLLKSLLAVFVADGVFDEAEHGALVDYTAAIGFDREGAPDMLRKLARDFVRGNIT